jgi:hypothetical protein
MSFEEFFQLVLEGHTFAEMSRRLGITPQAISQLYMKYVEPVTECDARLRRILYRRIARAAVLRHIPDDEPLGKIAGAARQYGFNVERVVGGSRIYKRELFINSRRCLVKIAKRAVQVRRGRANLYARFAFAGREAGHYERFVLYVSVLGWPKRIFVFTADDVARLRRGRATFCMYVPLRSGRSTTSQSLINWEGHESAWHLLA